MKEWQPNIITFLCNWCSYGAADLAGVSRFQYPPYFRIIRVPCSGRVDVKFILAAFRNGADAVWISGCHPGDCHYIESNYYARRRLVLFKRFLEFIGIDPNRLFYSWISSAEGTKFAETANIIADKVKALGPSDFFIKKRAEVP